MRHGRTLRRSMLGLVACLAGLSCSNGGDGPAAPAVTTGTISVSVATTGPDAPGRYEISLDDGAPRTIEANGTASFSPVEAGQHDLRLDAVPENCTVAGTNPRSASVTAGQTTSLQFGVTCVPLTGTVEVAAETSGSDVDPDGYGVSIDGGASEPVDVNGSLTPRELPIGDHEVELTGVADNCMVIGENPRAVTIETNATTSTTFQVECDPTTGLIEVTTTTSGPDPDPDGYTVELDGMASQSVDTNGTVTFTGVSEGPHELALQNVAANCSVAQNPATSTVVAGETDAVGFDITCEALTGDLRVTANTTGAPLDPDGYTVSVDGGAPLALAVNDDTLTFAGVMNGDRSVLLDDIDPSCSVTGSNPRTVTVPAGGSVLAVFDVTCTTDPGAIELTTVTTGLDPDPDGYSVSLDGGAPQAIGSDDTLVFGDLTAGEHSLLLDGIADNCAAQPPNPATPVVVGNDTTEVTMTVDCSEIPNTAPAVAISSPDTTSGTAPLTVGPGTPVTFTGEADDPEDGPLTGASLVWTSNVDGQIGTGESFVTSTLSEGQHTVTLTATDSEMGSASETVLVVVTPPPAPGYQITLRLEEGVTLTSAQRTAIDDAVARLESIISDDVPDVPATFGAMTCGAQIPPIDETIDDLLLYLAIVPIDGPGNILGSAGPCVLRGSSIPVLGGMRFDVDDLETIVEPNGLLDELLVHEAMHVMGFGTLWGILGLLEDPSTGNPGADTYFDGPAALAQFDALGGAAYTGGNVVPVENDTDTYGPGSLDGHWRESVFIEEVMTPSVNLGVNPLSVLTIGQFEDLGYGVDYGAADPYSPTFTLRAPGAAGFTLHLGNDVLRGPLWILEPGGRAVRVR